MCGLVWGCGRSPDPSRFNVLVLTLDTTRADRIGAFGGTAVPTPHLDAAATDGVRFTDAVSTNPLTLPAHASMFTGRYPFRHGVRHNGAYRLPPTETTLAERLREAGLRTGAFVGAFVLDASFGLDQGFDAYSGIASDGSEADFLRPSSLQRTADAVNRSFFEWLDAEPARRFFAWVHYYDPHSPYAPPESTGLRLEGSGYDREISFVDGCFGELVEGLRRRGVLDRTILVVVGDHGESLGSHGEKTHGIFLYEPAIHVPFFVRAPGLVRAGETYGSPVSIADVAPTVLGLLGLPPLAGADGVSLFGSGGRLAEEDRARRVYAETWMPRIEFGWSDLSMLRGERLKFIDAPRRELYDLEADPVESTNLATVDGDVADDLGARLAELLAGGSGSGAGAERALTAEEIARLQSLGYLRGGSLDTTGRTGRWPDPKDHVREAVELQAAEEELERGRLAESLVKFDRVLEENRGNVAALLGRARALLRTGNLGSAEDAALEALSAVARDPDAPGPMADNARGLLATIAALRGRYDEADRILRSDREHRDGKKSPTTLLLTAAKNRDDAAAIVRIATGNRPADPWSWAAALEFARKTSESDAVSRAKDRLAHLGPEAVPALIDAGASAQQNGAIALAEELFEMAAAIAPDHPDALGYLGTVRLAAGNLDEADRIFERVGELRPTDPRAPMYRANIALLQGDEERARALIEETLRRDPSFVPALVNYARWLGENGRIMEARAALQDALARRPGDPGATALLRDVGARAGTR